jgi:hypothetical protein
MRVIITSAKAAHIILSHRPTENCNVDLLGVKHVQLTISVLTSTQAPAGLSHLSGCKYPRNVPELVSRGYPLIASIFHELYSI